MDRTTELGLIDELLALKVAKSAFLDETVARHAASAYTSETRFAREQQKLFRALPVALAHSCELPKAGSFVTRRLGGVSVLLTRDRTGSARAFVNACRHRGSQLVSAGAGCQQRFSCPYHAWTYASTGELVGAPHFDEGFPGIDKAELGLRALACSERFGLVWVSGTGAAGTPDERWFAGLEDDLAALGIGSMGIAAQSTEVRKANWKIVVEGGIEAYHFRVAHRDTIGPHFEDNLSSYRQFGPHMRAILPRTSLAALDRDAREEWRLRDHANVLYTLLPATQFLVMQDHVVWITLEPLSAATSQIRIVTLAPTDGPDAEGKDDRHWARNHEITSMTLDEDFTLGEGIQANASAGLLDPLYFGRFEGALASFNQTVDRYIAD